MINAEMRDKELALRAELKTKTTGEIRLFRARYCGPFNQLLSNKIYGCQVDLKWIDQLLLERDFEDIVLT